MLGLYRAISVLAGPLIDLWLQRRAAQGKEDPERKGERLGYSNILRPRTDLVWIHGASVGEAVSVLPLIEAMLREHPDLHVLLTTGTVTSARMMAERLPERAIHQYAPVDKPAAVRRFLGHWRPDLGIWVESEFWPNMIHEAKKSGMPMALVNARMSEKSYRRWRRLPQAIRPILNAFDLCVAQSMPDAGRLASLGLPNVTFVGNLKSSAPPLPADARDLHQLRQAIRRRTVWVAASTHPGEEEIIATVHRDLKAEFPNLLTVVVPRHPHRGADVAEIFERRGINCSRRSLDQPVTAEVGALVGDTIGEMGLFYRLGDVVFVGGSLIEHGGQNPLEAARLDSVLLFGPNMWNFADAVGELLAAGAAEEVADGEALCRSVRALLRSDERRAQRIAAARRTADEGNSVVDQVLEKLEEIMPPRAESNESA
jgi:3-deoxy-D-manno-octulosonic-acid transferase